MKVIIIYVIIITLNVIIIPLNVIIIIQRLQGKSWKTPVIKITTPTPCFQGSKSEGGCSPPALFPAIQKAFTLEGSACFYYVSVSFGYSIVKIIFITIIDF